MPLEPWLMEILACPCEQHAPLCEEHDDAGNRLVCTRCATTFPIRDEIPVLLLDEATPGPQGIGADLGAG